MPAFASYRYRCHLLVTLVVLTGLWAATMPGSVSARVITCRKDPIVSLSNGKQITITVTISTDASNVTSSTYVVHAPVRTSVTKIVYTGGTSTSTTEKVVFSADLAATRYSTDTLVTTTPSGIAVSATTAIGTVSATLSGWSGTHMIVQITST